MDFLIIALAVIASFVIVMIVTAVRANKAVKSLTQEEFIKGYRKAQLIDVREKKDFEAGHILGARNIPYSQLRHRLNEVHPGTPVYLYDQNGGRSARAAMLLKKQGYENLYHLQGGFRQWTGKIRSK